MKWSIVLLIMSVAAVAQTSVDLRTQSKSVDFSGAPLTKPARIGSSLPGTCSTGEAFFNSSAPAGFNLNLCVATNVWLPVGGDAESILTSTVSALPSVCNVGDVRFTTDATVAGGGFLTYWCTAANTWTQFGYVGGGSGALASNCSSLPCTIDVTATVPLKASANTWTGANDFSGAAKTAPFQAGAADPATCSAVSHDFFFNTTTNSLKSCNTINTWTVVGRPGGGIVSVFYPAGLTNSAGSSAQTNWGVDSGGPALTCNTTSPSPCYLTFSNTGLPKAAYLTLVAPSTFTSLTLTVEWFSNSTAAGNISMQADVQCLSKDSTAAIGGTPVWTGPGNNAVANNTAIGSVRRQTVFTAVGTCAAGDMMRVRFQRVATSDTYADVIRFLGASVTY